MKKLTKKENEKMWKNFEVKGICREDLIESIGEKKAMELEDYDMKYIAETMGEYLQEDYWRCLDEALRKAELL